MVWLDLMIGGTFLGNVEIRRREHLDLTNQAAIQDAVSTYEVSRSGRLVGTVRHRYGDGAWRLLALASALIADKDAGTPRGPLSSTESAQTAPPGGGGCIEPPEALTEADRDVRARLPAGRWRVTECECVRDSDWYACVDGSVYGPCEDEDCSGSCELKGGCDCLCHPPAPTREERA